jgi:ATP-dependent helicase HrpB
VAALPIDAHLPIVVDAVRSGRNVVLRAEPGTGKTTRVPPALLGATKGDVWVQEPRRIAARAAARRVAAETGSRLGGLVGHAVRFDRVGGRDTRLWYVTDGILLRRLQSDPLLDGIGVLVLDELHERSAEAELALAMARQIQREVRPDLVIVAMSATLEIEALASFLDAAIVSVPGAAHPVAVRWRPWDGPLADGVARAIRAVWDDTTGDVLAFLPGVGDILRTADQLAALPVLPLYGDLAPEQQDRVLRPSDERRVILATNVAESSLTVPGVRVVVDGGWEKLLQHDSGSGLDRLVQVPISQASATQRAGRAGREGPGTVVRLWSEATHGARAPFRTPELQRTDLCGPVLAILASGEPDPAAFAWFDPPALHRVAAACALLERLGLLTGGFLGGSALTPLGERVAGWPLHPRLGKALSAVEEEGAGADGCLGLALLQEKDVPPPSVETAASDLQERIDAVRRGRVAGRSALQVARQLEGFIGGGHARNPETALSKALLAAYPDRVCRRREPGSDRARMVGGRGVRLDRRSVVRDAPCFLALAIEDRGPDATVTMACAIDEAWLAVEVHTVLGFDGEQVVATRERRHEDLVFDSHPASVDPSDPRVTEILLGEARGLTVEGDLAHRVAFAARHGNLVVPQDLLASAAVGARSLAEIRARVPGELLASLGHAGRRTLDTLAPATIETPSGRVHPLVYAADPAEPPVLAVKIQELFGLRASPTVAGGRVRVRLHLLAPNGRPQQVTDDLAGFWSRTWPEVRKELRGRYPKHPWPEDPLTAIPTHRAKPR